jgi:hypothetical protein
LPDRLLQPTGEGHEDDSLGVVWGDRVDSGVPGPGDVEDAALDDPPVGDEAVRDRDDLVRPVLAQAGASLVVDGELHTRPPTQAVLAAREGLDGDLHVDSRQPRELLADDGRLEIPLVRKRSVLEVATPTAPGTRIRARPVHAVRRGGEDLDGVAAEEPAVLPALGDRHPNALAGQRMPDEDDPSIDPGDAVSAVGDRTDVDDCLDAE